MSTSEIANIEAQIKDLRELVAKKDLALVLENNREFKELILEGFLEKECARFVRNSADPAFDAQQRADSLAMAQAAGHLKRWLSTTVRMGMQAQNEIAQAEEAITELRQEGKEE